MNNCNHHYESQHQFQYIFYMYYILQNDVQCDPQQVFLQLCMHPCMHFSMFVWRTFPVCSLAYSLAYINLFLLTGEYFWVPNNELIHSWNGKVHDVVNYVHVKIQPLR